MEWIYFALIAMVLWSIVNILDKHIISHELRDPWVVTTIFGFVMYLIFIILAFIFDGLHVLSTGMKAAAFMAGMSYSVALWFYYYVMKREEVSRFVPILALEPFLMALVGYFLFAERFSVVNYIGILLIVGGAILISIQRHRAKMQNKYLLLLALCSIVFFGIRNLLYKYAIADMGDFWAVMFWTGLGGIIIPILIFVFHHPHLRKQGWEGVYHLSINAGFSAVALIFFTKAMAIGSIGLASALVATKPLVVFLVATFLSFFYPKVMRERLSKFVLIKKSIAIILIVLGGIFIVF